MNRIRLYEALGRTYPVRVCMKERYANERVVLTLVSANLAKEGQPVARASINMPELACPAGEVWIKSYSENTGMREWLIKEGIIERESEAVATLAFGNVVSRHKLIQKKVTGPMDTCSSHKEL